MNKYSIDRTCPICEKIVNDNLKNSRVSFFSSPKNFYKIENRDSYCKKCEYVFSYKKPTQFFLNFHYKNKILPKNLKPDYNLKNQINFIKKYFHKKQRILEIGSSNNYLVNQLNKKGFYCKGYDLNNKSMKSVSNFDVLILNHVLEHVSDLNYFMRKLNKDLKMNSKIIVEVPHLNKYSHKYLNALTTEHLYHFSKKSLIDLFSKFNLKFLFLEKKLISRPNSIRIVFEKVNKINKNPNYKNKNKINLKLIYKNILNSKKENILKNSKKIVNIINQNKSSKIIFWGFNTRCVQYYDFLSNKIRKSVLIVDLNFSKFNNFNYMGKSLKIYNPDRMIDSNNIYIIFATSWFSDIKKLLLKKNISEKKIFKIL